MKHINNLNDLDARILELELKGKEETIALKLELSNILENVNPISILSKSILGVIKSPEIKNELFSIALGMGAGYLAKKVVVRNSEDELNELAGNIVGMKVAHTIDQNSDTIRLITVSILKQLMKKQQ